MPAMDFATACRLVETGHDQIAQDDLLTLYGLYKTATVLKAPPSASAFSFTRAAAKSRAWQREYARVAGDQDEAMRLYIELAQQATGTTR
jgi:acyl-CoA-binding protein